MAIIFGNKDVYNIIGVLCLSCTLCMIL